MLLGLPLARLMAQPKATVLVSPTAPESAITMASGLARPSELWTVPAWAWASVKTRASETARRWAMVWAWLLALVSAAVTAKKSVRRSELASVQDLVWRLVMASARVTDSKKARQWARELRQKDDGESLAEEQVRAADEEHQRLAKELAKKLSCASPLQTHEIKERVARRTAEAEKKKAEEDKKAKKALVEARKAQPHLYHPNGEAKSGTELLALRRLEKASPST